LVTSPERIATGGIVRERQIDNTRLHFSLVQGEGPEQGWVSTVAPGGKVLVQHAQFWEVIGGADKGGLLCRTGKVVGSAKTEPERIATGAVVAELKLDDDRLHFVLVKGEGPAQGWVSTAIQDKALLQKCDAAAAGLDDDSNGTGKARPKKQKVTPKAKKRRQAASGGNEEVEKKEEENEEEEEGEEEEDRGERTAGPEVVPDGAPKLPPWWNAAFPCEGANCALTPEEEYALDRPLSHRSHWASSSLKARADQS